MLQKTWSICCISINCVVITLWEQSRYLAYRSVNCRQWNKDVSYRVLVEGLSGEYILKFPSYSLWTKYKLISQWIPSSSVLGSKDKSYMTVYRDYSCFFSQCSLLTVLGKSQEMPAIQPRLSVLCKHLMLMLYSWFWKL